jgi:preprotein translocase subunit SecG
MEIAQIILTIVEVLVSVALILVVLFQSGKESGLSSAIAGGSDTYMGKGKSSTMDQKLAKATKWIALVWVLLVLTLNILDLIH